MKVHLQRVRQPWWAPFVLLPLVLLTACQRDETTAEKKQRVENDVESVVIEQWGNTYRCLTFYGGYSGSAAGFWCEQAPK